MAGNTVSKTKLLALRDSQGQRILSIKGYYEEKLAPINPKFSRFSFSRSRTVVCPFHSDNDPSFGCIKSKGGGEHYHCFGCGVYGDFIDFYREMERVYFGKVYSTDEELYSSIIVCYGLEGYDLSVSSVAEESITREQAMKNIESGFTLPDYERSVRKGRLLGKSIPYFNLQLLKFLAENRIEKEN